MIIDSCRVLSLLRDARDSMAVVGVTLGRNLPPEVPDVAARFLVKVGFGCAAAIKGFGGKKKTVDKV